VDLYRRLGIPLTDDPQNHAVRRNGSDTRPSPETGETRSNETTDESGLMVTFGCVAP
jgi:hypothetical protein